MEKFRQRFLSFQTIFCTFTPLEARKKKHFEKMEKMLADVTMLHNCTKNHDRMIICFTVPEIPSMTDVVFIFHFGFYFAS